jgi:hypothetical protein
VKRIEKQEHVKRRIRLPTNSSRTSYISGRAFNSASLNPEQKGRAKELGEWRDKEEKEKAGRRAGGQEGRRAGG